MDAVEEPQGLVAVGGALDREALLGEPGRQGLAVGLLVVDDEDERPGVAGVGSVPGLGHDAHRGLRAGASGGEGGDGRGGGAFPVVASALRLHDARAVRGPARPTDRRSSSQLGAIAGTVRERDERSAIRRKPEVTPR